MNFYEFYQLLNENTVSQEIKRLYNKKKSNYNLDDDFESFFIRAYKTYGNIIPERLGLNENSKRIIIKWIIYQNLVNRFYDQHVFNMITDFLSSNIDQNGNLNPQLSSKFNNINFRPQDLLLLDRKYHDDLKNKQRNKPGREGKILLNFPDGYFWTDLERKYCEIEKDTMGHCGNVGGDVDDTILSLRDRKNIPHLTFILNKGVLGEMKGRGNDKPSKKYHSYIIELLKLPIIKRIRGGGYLKENNFKLGDLTEEQLQELIKLKPNFENDFILEKISNYQGTEGKDIDDVLTKEEIFKFLKEAKSNIKNNLEETLKIAYYTKNPEVLNELVEMFYSNGSIMINVAANNYTTEEILEKLVDYENLNVKERVSTNRNASIEILKQMAEDKDDNVRVAVATSPILRKFFSSPYFRQYSKEAKEILSKLANDEVQLVADTANFALRGSQDPITSSRIKGSYKDEII